MCIRDRSYTVETNRFGANWFISGGIGAQMYFGDTDGKADSMCIRDSSKAMVNSGVADSVAKFIIGLSDDYDPHVLLAMLFIITNLFTCLLYTSGC